MDRDDVRDPDAPLDPAEVAEAEALRDALGSSAPNDAADFARALALTHAPRPIADPEHRALVAQAIARGTARRAAARRRRSGVAVALAGGLALAAAVALFVKDGAESDRPIPASASAASIEPRRSIEPLAPMRSTQPLFREPFARAGGESARIDRIASSRGADLRDNRFAAWGVR